MYKVIKKSYVLPAFVSLSLFFAACGSSNSNPAQPSNQNPLTEQPATTAAEQPSSPENLLPGQFAVRPPLQGVDVPKQKYKVNAQQGRVIEIPSGTKIEIPAGCFVDKNGKPISEEVEISYREFHNAADIIASGIPMQDKDRNYMETAGMFEIEGSLRGEEIFVAEGKTINVKMASFNDGDFDFFRLDPKDCQWDEIDGKGRKSPVVNAEKKAKINQLKQDLAAQTKPTKPLGGSKDKFTFDLDVNYESFPELSVFKGVVWEYAGNNPAEDPEKQRWVLSTNWVDVFLKKDGSNYKLMFTDNNNRKFETTVRPVLPEADLAMAQAAFDKLSKEYDAAKAAIDAELNRIQLQNDLFRVFGVNGFGIFNWDIIHNPGRVACPAEFTFEDIDIKELNINKVKFFLVTRGEKSVVTYNSLDGKTLEAFSFDPEQRSMMLAILPNNEIATVPYQFFEQFKPKKAGNQPINTMRLSFKKHPVSIKNVQDLERIMDIVG